MFLNYTIITTVSITTGLLLSIVIVLLYISFKNSYKFWSNSGIPFEEPEFIYGTMKDTIKQKVSLQEELTNLYRRYKEKGYKYFGGFFFNQPFFMPIDMGLVKNILTTDFDHFVDRGVYYDEENDPLSAHLFSLEGLKWKHLRQKLTPTFTSGKLKKMFQTLVDCTEELKNCLDESITKSEPVDIKQYSTKYTTDVIGSCAFGIECNSFKNPNSEFVKIGTKIFNPTIFERMKLFLSISFPQITKYFKIRVSNYEIDRFFRNLVKDTISHRETNNIVRNDFMQLLIDLKNKGTVEDAENDVAETDETIGTTLTLNEATAQAFLFFVAGFETSSTAMTFCLYELSKNPDVQEKTRRDIVNVLKKHDGIITYEAMKEMQYVERVISESLRKHPPVGILQRKVTQDYHIPDSDSILKKGSAVFISVTGIQEDPEYYPNPEIFDPDRFLEENKATTPDYTFLPFGDGPRNCIGSRFGLMQIKVGVCQLLLNYKFTLNSKTDDPLIFDPESFVQSVKNGIWLDAERI